jgi:hypothetical protein
VGYEIYLHTNTNQPERNKDKMKPIRKIHSWLGKLSDVLLQQYPSLRETIGLVASRVLNKAVEKATLKLR